MPLYEMICDHCEESFDILLSIEEMQAHLGGDPKQVCLKCLRPLRRSYKGINIQGDTCAGNTSCEGMHPDLGYCRGKSHMKQKAKERGLTHYERDTLTSQYLSEAHYIQKHGKGREARAAISGVFKDADKKRRRHAIQEAMGDPPEITRDDIAKTKAKLDSGKWENNSNG